MIELEEELELGICITRDDISQAQFRLLIMLRAKRNQIQETREKMARAEAAFAQHKRSSPIPDRR